MVETGCFEMHWLWKGPSLALSGLMIGMVKAYQWVVSPWIPKDTCRFEPTCSHYFILAVRKHGPIVGGAKGVWRVCRCNPFGGHGVDNP